MKKRFSIMGQEFGSNHEVELIQVDSNPQAVVDGLIRKTLKVTRDGMLKKAVRKYSWLRIVDNGEAI